MKNKKWNIVLSVAFAAIAFTAFSFVAPESNNVSSENQHFSAIANSANSAYGSIPADFVSAKYGSQTSKTKNKADRKAKKANRRKTHEANRKARKANKKAKKA